MNLYRSGDPNQRKPILKPLSTPSKSRTPEHPRKSEPQAKPGLSKLQSEPVRQETPSPEPTRTPESHEGFASRRVTVPVWLIAVLAIALIAAPLLTAILMFDSSSDDDDEPMVAQIQPTATMVVEEEESDDEVPLALDIGEMFDSRQWDDPAPSSVSDRQQYLLDQGVDPDFEMRYGADEVERLQAELEAIQRNSAMLRSLARQQSGDLSAAYSSLEASQEQSDGALEDLQSRINDLEERIQAVDDIARELRDLLGMPPSESGVGGPLPPGIDDENTDPWLTLRAEIVAIEQWAGELVFDLDEINTEAQLRLAQINQAGVDRGPSLGADIEFYDSMPMGWPVEGPITSRFGYRSSPFAGEGGATELHTGIDIAARTGTPVIATGGGTVQVSGDNGGYGLLVIIDHGRGVTSWYGHNSRLLVTPGQRVNAGDIIAEVGSTGRSTGPHVHYEVRVHGVPEDPLSYMQMTR
jgi:murein DD-endopeptidase MepM/ murein hydrolase activator NlpD